MSLNLKVGFVRISYISRFVHAPLYRLLLLSRLLDGDGNVSAKASRSISSNTVAPGEEGCSISSLDMFKEVLVDRPARGDVEFCPANNEDLLSSLS